MMNGYIFAHQHVLSIGSTNDLALDAFCAGERQSTWFTADEQVSGKGRRGRVWASPPGNFYGSLLLINPSKTSDLPQLAFVASLAIHRAIAGLLPPQMRPDLTVKWPNDLLLGGAKLVGILLEASVRDSAQAAIIGCGINLAHNPPDTPYPTTSLAAQGVEIKAKDFYEPLQKSFARTLDEWQAGANFLDIRDAWLRRTSGIGKPIKVRLPTEELHGRFDGVDENGHLLLFREGAGTKVISAGDVFPL